MRFLLAIGLCLGAVHAACAQFAPPADTPAAPLPSAPMPPAMVQTAALPTPGGAQFPSVGQMQIHPSVARIVVPGNGSISYGSGTLIYTNESYGLVVTNWHVVNEAAGPISVHFPDGFYSLGSVQDVDRDWDLALIAIRKPNATPVPLADRAPRPGEVLTIAGYGSGQYRAASGLCTQYVAPGLEFPYEMVEVAVSARQGDSGGPIFNDRGQLAGVLFGEGDGRTSGSYCGRVRWFLSRIVPNMPNPSNVMVASAGPLEPINNRSAAQASASESPAMAISSRQPARNIAPASSQWQTVDSPAGAPPPVVASTRADSAPESDVVQIGWRDIAGDSLVDQAKTVLAAIGLLAIVLHVLGWMSRG